jgi:hypothetical protein
MTCEVIAPMLWHVHNRDRPLVGDLPGCSGDRGLGAVPPLRPFHIGRRGHGQDMGAMTRQRRVKTSNEAASNFSLIGPATGSLQ